MNENNHSLHVGVAAELVFEADGRIRKIVETALCDLVRYAHVSVVVPEDVPLCNVTATISNVCQLYPEIKKYVRWCIKHDVLTDPEVKIFYSRFITPVPGGKDRPEVRRVVGVVGLQDVCIDVKKEYEKITAKTDVPSATACSDTLDLKVGSYSAPVPPGGVGFGGSNMPNPQVGSGGGNSTNARTLYVHVELTDRQHNKRSPERVADLLASLNSNIVEPQLPGFTKLANEAAAYLREAIEAGVWSSAKTRS